jgi:hypothetical protein
VTSRYDNKRARQLFRSRVLSETWKSTEGFAAVCRCEEALRGRVRRNKVIEKYAAELHLLDHEMHELLKRLTVLRQRVQRLMGLDNDEMLLFWATCSPVRKQDLGEKARLADVIKNGGTFVGSGVFDALKAQPTFNKGRSR